jgi:transposase
VIGGKIGGTRRRVGYSIDDHMRTELVLDAVIAAMLNRDSGNVTRFANRDRYAAYNGTAPAEFSAGGRVAHRVSKCGNRILNHALHFAGICPLRNPGRDSRVYYE